MESHRSVPNPDQMSLMIGIILVAYAVSQFLVVPVNPIGLQLPGLYLPIPFEFRSLVLLTVAVLAAAGMDWIVAAHPLLGSQERRHHGLLPALTAWVIGIPLEAIPTGPAWWALFLFGGLLLVAVIYAEYIMVDPLDERATLAEVGLSALSLVLFLVLALSIRLAGVRLYLVASGIGLGTLLVCLRVFYLRLGQRWHGRWASGIALIMAQLAAGFHYLPLSPLQFGLVLAGILYGLISIAGDILEGHFVPGDLIEPGVILAAAALLALLVG